MRPYLIIPTLIPQPTWGGRYILELKGWDKEPHFSYNKIGQSYELTSASCLSQVADSTDPQFIKEASDFNSGPSSLLRSLENELQTRVHANPDMWLGPEIAQSIGHMPLLIKLNQALGNSFQLHVRPGTQHPRWKAKPESWYFLEDGYISCGVADVTKTNEYKHVCHEIDEMMKSLSVQVKSKTLSVVDARTQAKSFITARNPWQYVNRYEMKKNDLLDLSQGGVHHSWEEHPDKKFPLGNIIYEVQLDVMDPLCTIRAFDQGKMADDGSIREIHIDDYFQFLDTSSHNNDIANLKQVQDGTHLLKSPFYAVDILEVVSGTEVQMGRSFEHLYVRDGDVEIYGGEVKVRLTQGHSCFIPHCVGKYTIHSRVGTSVVLKTYI